MDESRRKVFATADRLALQLGSIDDVSVRAVRAMTNVAMHRAAAFVKDWKASRKALFSEMPAGARAIALQAAERLILLGGLTVLLHGPEPEHDRLAEVTSEVRALRILIEQMRAAIPARPEAIVRPPSGRAPGEPSAGKPSYQRVDTPLSHRREQDKKIRDHVVAHLKSTREGMTIPQLLVVVAQVDKSRAEHYDWLKQSMRREAEKGGGHIVKQGNEYRWVPRKKSPVTLVR